MPESVKSHVQWCTICNARPSDGSLKIIDPVTEELIDIPACEPCVSDPEKVEFI